MIRAVDLNYPLGCHAWTILRIGPNFDEPLDNDVPTNEEGWLSYSDEESEDEEQFYNVDTCDDFSNDKGTDDDMTTIVPFE